MAVELGSTRLEHLVSIDVDEAISAVHHAVPGMNGSLSQVLGRPSVVVRFRGLFYGPTAADDLGALRAAHLEGKPVDFFTEAVGQGYFTQVLITRLQVSQHAGYLDQFDFACEVREYVEPPAPAVADPFAALDADLLSEAAGFLDDVQNALDEVAGLVDLVANAPSFGNPTTKLPALLDAFTALADQSGGPLTTIRDLIG